MSNNSFLNNNKKSIVHKINKKMRFFCDLIYLGLYHLTSICEDRKLKKLSSDLIRDAQSNKEKVDYLNSNKEIILGGFSTLKQEIFTLRGEKEQCFEQMKEQEQKIKALENLVTDILQIVSTDNSTTQEVKEFIISKITH